MHAEATFRLQDWGEQSFSENEDGDRLTQGTFVIAYAGDLQGEGVLGELKHYAADGSASVYGLERFTGSLGGRSGTFVLEHIGELRMEMLASRRTIVRGSATGELKGLRGEIHFASGPAEEFSLAFDYEFD